ncbi:GNAT family N-acetyltransferase [Virgibacillus siamensis]|uniref:GNAT family N-acetyltransferase n=1 Tax=Virgibacillus siamensis TaxID=480071 RepID=A0ABN1GMJ8_9BACI
MLETTRCHFRNVQKSDLPDVKRLYKNEKVREYLGGVRQDDTITALFEDMLSDSNDLHWTIREKQTDQFIGLISIGLHHDSNEVELSYQLLPDWWGRGYATEAVQSIIQFAFDELNLSRLVAETQTANTPSCRLLERAGMKFEKKVIRFEAEQAIYYIGQTE